MGFSEQCFFGDAISRFFNCILCGADPDLVFAYSTVRIVRIRDRRLGLLHYFFLSGVFLYIIIYTMLMQKSYLFIKDASGMVRLQLKSPGDGHTLPPEALPYCGNGTYSFKSQTFPQLDCVYLNEIEARYPGEELDALFLTTRIKYQEVYRPSGCTPPTSPSCTLRESGADSRTYLVAQPEMYTLWMDHAMTPDGFGENAYSGQTRSTGYGLTGEIMNHDGTEIFDPCDDYPADACPDYICLGKKGKRDIVPMKTLLRAGGVDMDDPSELNTTESIRYAGVVLKVTILYDNTATMDQTAYSYQMKVNALRQMEYKSLDQERTETFGNSTLVDRHGIRIVFEQTGTIGHFDFQTMLVNLVSALGLMAVGTFFVDTVALYFMSLREVYSKCKIIDTVDFSDYDGVEPLMSHDYCVRSRALAAVGSRLKSIESRIGDIGFNSPYSRLESESLLHDDGHNQ